MLESKFYDDFRLLSDGTNNPNPPDAHIKGDFIEPSDDFILCQDSKGVVTASFGDNCWDFNPYRLTSKKISIIRFEVDYFDKESEHYLNLIKEFKLLLFKVIYYVDGGHTGFLSPAVIVKYSYAIKGIIHFILDPRSYSFMGQLNISDVLSNHQYLAKAITMVGKKSFPLQLTSLISSLKSIEHKVLGFYVATVKGIKKVTKQHPVIPPRIYLNFVNINDEWIDKADKVLLNIEHFIFLLSDKNNYKAKDSIKKEERLASGVEFKTFIQVLEEWELLDFIKKEMNIEDECNLHRIKFINFLSCIQYRLKSILHFYTGMRDEEINRLPYDCVSNEVIRKAVFLDGEKLIPEKTIQIVSITTKYMGFKKSASWIAPPEALKAISILQRITRGVAMYNNIEPSECYLLNNTSSIALGNGFEKVTSRLKGVHSPFNGNEGFIINQDDFNCLQSTDPERDFTLESKFSVGESWPFTPHQFRRSLAYYATNSGFVSLPSLKRQFKHMLLEVTKYYGKNFSNMKTIFGYYDEELDKFILPKGHIALEVQTGIPMAIAEDILREVFDSETVLFGKSGAYIERQKPKHESQEVSIITNRADTLKRAENGEISYSRTLLGGCTKVGGCDCAMLGEVTGCLTSECAIIKPKNVQLQIDHLESFIQQYDKSTGEYQVLKDELDTLKKYREFNISKEVQ